jgi:hypothetical protein
MNLSQIKKDQTYVPFSAGPLIYKPFFFSYACKCYNNKTARRHPRKTSSAKPRWTLQCCFPSTKEIQVSTFSIPTVGGGMWLIKRFYETSNTLIFLRLKIYVGMGPII